MKEALELEEWVGSRLHATKEGGGVRNDVLEHVLANMVLACVVWVRQQLELMFDAAPRRGGVLYFLCYRPGRLVGYSRCYHGDENRYRRLN